MSHTRRTSLVGAQRGFSLVTAIFLIVVLAGLAVYAVRISTLQGQGVTEGLRAAQAFAAARSGIEWAAYRALHGGPCAAATLNLTEGGTAGYTVTIACSVSTHTEGTSTVNVWVFDVRAEAGVYGGPDYVSRRVQSKITDAS